MKYCSIFFRLTLLLLVSFPAHAEYAWDMLKQHHFKSSYFKVLGNKRSEPWISSLSGPSNELIHRKIEGKDYILANSCMQHSCGENFLVLAYSPDSKLVFVKLTEAGVVTWLGRPTTKIREALDNYYENYYIGK